jgi:hypothetical protein
MQEQREDRVLLAVQAALPIPETAPSPGRSPRFRLRSERTGYSTVGRVPSRERCLAVRQIEPTLRPCRDQLAWGSTTHRAASW